MHECWCGNKNLLEYNIDYYRCIECGTLVSKKEITDAITVIKDDESDFYGKKYWLNKMLKVAQKDNIDDLLDLYFEGRVLYWMQYFLKYALPKDGPIAEVGCGLGEFSFLLKKLGFKQKAFELSPEICNFVESEFQINIECSTFIKGLGQYFGIVAFDLIEHLTKPESFIKDVYDSLDDNGVFMIQMPRYDNKITFTEMLMTKRNFSKSLVPDEHIYLFSVESAKYILASVGFTYVEFLPAFFGDDYDMFLVAFKGEKRIYEDKVIVDYLNSNSEFRLIKNMLNLFKKLEEQRINNIELEENCNCRLTQIIELNEKVKFLEQACNDRLEQIYRLTEMVHFLEDRERGEEK